MKNAIVHVEWSSTDLERTKDFLSGLFGWKFEPWSENYILFKTPKGVDGGIKRVEKRSLYNGNSPIAYVEVDNIDSYIKKVESLGGKFIEKREVPRLGWISYVADVDGNMIGLVQRKGR